MEEIWIVEDDVELARLLAERFEEEGYACRTFHDGSEAIAALEALPSPRLMILDQMLPGAPGIDVCRAARAAQDDLYILFLSARQEETDRIVGLEVGADDYVTKPFSMPELVARVRSAFRRLDASAARGIEKYDLGTVQIDPERRSVIVRGEEVNLTVLEYDLLLCLARHADRPLTRLQLLKEVWKTEYEGYERTVDTHIQRLRAKVEETPSRPKLIMTVWGVGYSLKPPSTSG